VYLLLLDCSSKTADTLQQQIRSKRASANSRYAAKASCCCNPSANHLQTADTQQKSRHPTPDTQGD
jgi:hypothetical protein